MARNGTSSTASVAARKLPRGLFFAAVLLLLLSPRVHGQEAAVAEVADLDEPVDADAAAACDRPAPEDADVATAAGEAGDVVEEAAAELAPAVDIGEEAAETETAPDLDSNPTPTPTEAEAGAEAPANKTDAAATETGGEAAADSTETPAGSAPPAQAGPFIDLLGDLLLSLEMVDETHAQVRQHHTNEALNGKKVVGLYFSADWCGPCRQFTPELVDFYNKMNARRGRQNEFEIIWVSRCRTVDAFGQYFTQMPWLALPPDVAGGPRGQELGERYRVQGIPSLVLLDEVGNVITRDARTKIPMDRAGLRFPWRSPLSILVSALPKGLRLTIKNQVAGVVGLLKLVLFGKK